MQHRTKKPAKTRRIVRTKLSKHKTLHDAAISLHHVYCSLTGFMHVLPDFYIIGAAKCGTTSLYQYLIRHPYVHPGIGKEIHYFEELYYRGENWYRACFPFKFQKYFFKLNQKNDLITGDSTPRYIDHPYVPRRIKELTPNAKFIVMLRNPIDRAFSHYNMNLKNQYETLSFEDAIKQEPQRIKGEYEMMEKTEKVSFNYYLYAYLDRGIYVNRLKNWLDIFPKKNFLIIKSEEFFKDTSIQYKRVIEFLNLPKWDLKEYPAHMVGRYQENDIATKLRNELQQFFKPYNEKLYKLLDTDFGWD